MTQVSLVEKR